MTLYIYIYTTLAWWQSIHHNLKLDPTQSNFQFQSKKYTVLAVIWG